MKRLKDHFYAPPTDADDSDSSDDESSGLVVQKDQKNLDDTDQLSEYDNAEDNENEYDNENGEDNESGESEAPSNKRSRGKIYAPFASFKSLDSAFLALQSEWLDGNCRKQPSHVCSVNRLIRPVQFNHQALMTNQKKRSRSLRRKNGTQLHQLNSARASANGKIENIFLFSFS